MKCFDLYHVYCQDSLRNWSLVRQLRLVGRMRFTIKIMAEIVVGILQVAFVGTGMYTFVRCDGQLPIGELDFAISGLRNIYQIDHRRHFLVSFINELV